MLKLRGLNKRIIQRISGSVYNIYPINNALSSCHFSISSYKAGSSLDNTNYTGSGKTAASQDELAHFKLLADSWWDTQGPQRILHKLNLLRMDFINQTLRENLKISGDNVTETGEDDGVFVPGYSLELLPEPVANQVRLEQNQARDKKWEEMKGKLEILDVGCGGGILSECLARLDITKKVRGIDLSSEVLEAAKAHKALDPILDSKLDYRLIELENIGKDEKYDIVTMFEMLEHVPYPSEVLSITLDKVKPGGWIFLSTINRTPISWFTTIFMGEDILKIVPKGTHTLSKYINESELRDWFNKQPDFEVVKSAGSLFIPAYGWKLTDDCNVGNYFMAVRRK